MNSSRSIILGLSFFYHDAAAALLIDGVPVAMAEEERFSRKKHDSGFPVQAIEFVLRTGGVSVGDLTAVVFYEKPLLKFERILKNAVSNFPFAPFLFARSLKSLLEDKIWIRPLISRKLNISPRKIYFSNHHLSHAASSFYPSPYKKAAVLTLDGVGEWATCSLGLGEGTHLTMFKELHFPNSLGLLYSAFTAFLGFEVNEGEYKVMGMAPYGKPQYKKLVEKLLITHGDGSCGLNLEYFSFHRSGRRTFSHKFVQLFGKPRETESHFCTRQTGWPSYFGKKPEGAEYEKLVNEQEYYADLAASVQAVLEDCVVAMANHLHSITGGDTLCLAGGVALNSVMNWRLAERTPFKRIFVQPAAGDGGGALGAALALHHLALGGARTAPMRHAFYGENYSGKEIESALDELSVSFVKMSSEEILVEKVAEFLKNGSVIGWYQGAFEWGPRALGNRSIIADPRRNEMKEIVNTKIKFREPYRPFAPSVLAEYADAYFNFGDISEREPARFMLYVVPVKSDKQKEVPAITHVDGSARPQLVFAQDCPRYHKLISAFYKKTAVPMLLNTSFNLRGEPIVTTPQNALATFAKSGMDYLIMDTYIISRKDLANSKLFA